MSKLRIVDNAELRKYLGEKMLLCTQKELALWGIILAQHMIPILEESEANLTDLLTGIEFLKGWSNDKVTTHAMREASFKIHVFARTCTNKVLKAAARTIGHSVAIAHMREHAMVASDYAIQTVGFAYNKEISRITTERAWQIEQIKIILKR